MGRALKKVCPTPCWICGITLKILTIRLSPFIGGTYWQRYIFMLMFLVCASSSSFRNFTVRPKHGRMFQFPTKISWKHCHPLADHVCPQKARFVSVVLGDDPSLSGDRNRGKGNKLVKFYLFLQKFVARAQNLAKIC